MTTLNDLNTKQLQDLVTCAICLDYYQDPRVLPCSHTFCFKCIQQLVKEGRLICPLRDDVIMYEDNIEKLPINRAAKDIVDFVLNINPFSDKKSCQSCDNCSENSAVNWCDVCVVHYCESCTRSIHSMKALQSHNIVPLTEKVHSICSEHPDEKFKYWCSKCEALVCRDCLLFKHRDHTFMPLTDAAIEAKTKFQAIVQDIDKVKKNLTKVLDETKSATDQEIQIVQEQKQDIEQTFVTLQRILEERKCTIIQELDNNELQMTNLLAQQLRDIDQHLNFTIVQELCVKRMLNSNDPMQILKLKSILSQNDNNFVVQYKKIDEGYTIMRPVFEKNATQLKQIFETISNFGSISSKPHVIKGCDSTTNSLNISKPDGNTVLTVKHINYARGYKFALKQPLQLHSIQIQSDYVGQHIGFVVNADGVIQQSETVNSDDSTMKSLTIPLQCDINNNDSVFVWAPSGNGSYAYKSGNNSYRTVNENCSVQSKCVLFAPPTNVGSTVNISDNIYSIDMILVID